MKISNFKKYTVINALIVIGVVAASQSALAQNFQEKHPRREQVLVKDNRIQQRINRNAGHLSGQYQHLSQEDRAIHNQEQRIAQRQGGGITRREQRQLNREENHLNHEISKDKQ